MSFLTEMTFRRMATVSRTAARSSNFTSTVPRAAFSTTVQLQKTPVETAKDGLKKVDRVVSDKLVDGIDLGVAAKDKAKEVTTGDVKGKAAELKGEAAGKAQELKGDANQAAGEAKGKAAELKGEAKKKVNEL